MNSFDAAGAAVTAASNATNALGALAAFKPVSFFDGAGAATGAAQNATNALAGLAAFSPLNAFDAAGAAANATNAMGALAAFKPVSYFDAAGSALNGTRLSAGSVNSNTLDGPTKAQLALGGTVASGAGIVNPTFYSGWNFDPAFVWPFLTNSYGAAMIGLTGTNLGILGDIVYQPNIGLLSAGAFAAGGVFYGNGSGLTNLSGAVLPIQGGGSIILATNAGKLTISSIAGGGNVLSSGNNAFTASNVFAGPTTFNLPPVGSAAGLSNLQWSALPGPVLTNAAVFDAAGAAANSTNAWVHWRLSSR